MVGVGVALALGDALATVLAAVVLGEGALAAGGGSSRRHATASMHPRPIAWSKRMRGHAIRSVMSLLSLLAHARVVERRSALSTEEIASLGELPAETARYADKRRDEFLLGRWVAKRALAELGAEVGVLPIAAERAPRWPAGFVGSITHCAGYAGAAVAPAGTLRGVGIDAQPVAMERSREALRRTATDAEIALLAIADEMTARTVAFSAKEALYKALAPTVGGYFGFEAARVSRGAGDEIELTLTRGLHSDLLADRTFLVRYSVSSGVAFAAVEWR